MKVAVVKYNAGNIFSVVHALKRMGVEPLLTDSPIELRSADRVIFPGQGEASNAMHYLREHGLDEVIRSLTQPVLGICVGAQLMCAGSEEGDARCMGIFPAEVRRFNETATEKVPHMGWNSLGGLKTQLFAGLEECPYVYFVHSYYPEICADTIATAIHGVTFSAALARDNFFACQFHPEKSGTVGETILKNFLSL